MLEENPTDTTTQEQRVTTELSQLFSESHDHSGARMFELLNDPAVSQITVNRFDRVLYVDDRGTQSVEGVFANAQSYHDWLGQVLAFTDAGTTSLTDASASVIEGSFDAGRTALHGSVHVATKELTRGDPALTIRKQPNQIITLDSMLNQGMLNEDMRLFLELAVRGRSNILVSGGSGAGKTTMARALSWYIDPSQRIVTAEEIDELHLADRLPNVVALTTHRKLDSQGRLIRETDLEELVRQALRMRADRIWLGETRGREAYAMVKSCNSGHDGSCTTIHADSGSQAIQQLITYVMESGLAEEVAREQVARGFHLVIQIARVEMGRRAVTEITELEPVREGNQQRRNTLFKYDYDTGQHVQCGQPSPLLLRDWSRYGVNY